MTTNHLLRYKGVAELLDVSEKTVKRLVDDELLKQVRLRRSVRITSDSVNKLLEFNSIRGNIRGKGIQK